jgi:hypothetical protein
MRGPTGSGNDALWRALHGLSHKISIGAIVLLLLNDHFLRIQFPSWFTGKLGDFAWLVFAPFVAALAVAWIARGRLRENSAGALAFLFIGAWFALAKTTEPVHRWTTTTLDFILGYRGSLRMDSSDLLALPALWLGWRVWRNADNRRRTVKPYVWVLLALGVMATVATSTPPPPTYGIGRVCRNGATTYAIESADASKAVYYASEDGGLSWQPRSTGERVAVGDCLENPPATTVSDGTRTYRVVVEPHTRRIESLSDGGKTWTVEIDLALLDSEARHVLYNRAGRGPLTAGPLDAVATAQGTVVVAMGTDGVLVRTAKDEWRWVAVGDFRYAQFSVADHLATLASPPGAIISLAFTMLAFLTIGKRFTAYPSIIRKPTVVIMWTVFAIGWLPTPVYGVNLLLPLFIPIGAGLAIVSAVEVYRVDRSALGALTLLSLASGALFFLPFVLWAFGTVPRWELAHMYASVVGAAAVLASRLTIRRMYPDLFGDALIEAPEI